MVLENRKDLLLVRNRLATQKTSLHLVNLPPGVSDEAGDRAAARFPHALVPQSVERGLCSLNQRPAARQIRLHPLRMPLRSPRRAHLVEQFLDLPRQMAPLTPAAHRVLLGRPPRLPQQATHRIPQQVDVRRIMDVPVLDGAGNAGIVSGVAGVHVSTAAFSQPRQSGARSMHCLTSMRCRGKPYLSKADREREEEESRCRPRGVRISAIESCHRTSL